MRSFYDRDAPIYTMSRFLPPSKLMDAEVIKSIVGDGCVIKSGTSIKVGIAKARRPIAAAVAAAVAAVAATLNCRRTWWLQH